MENSSNDEQLVREFIEDGEQKAFQILVTRYQLSVCRMAASILGPVLASESEDVAQEVLLRVHRGLKQFQFQSTFKTWLFKITYNTALSYKHRLQRSRAVTTDEIVADVPAQESYHSVEMKSKHWRRVLNSAIEKLPVEYQSAVRLYYWYQLPIVEIAEQLCVPKNTIKSYLHRARKLLAARLDDYRNES